MAKNKPMTFSYSKLSTYKECPRRYKFKYIEKIPGTARHYFAFGNAVHSALEYMHSQKSMPTATEVMAAFTVPWDAKDWRDAGYPYKEAYARARMDGAMMLKEYHAKHKDAETFATEYRTDVLVDGLLVRIIADRIQHLGAGTLRILDYKTGKNVTRTPEQLQMYQKIVECDPKLLAMVKSVDKKIKKVKVHETVFIHVPTLQEYPFPRYKPTEIKTFWADVLKVAKNIKGEKFDPTPCDRACKWCDYKTRCPAHLQTGPDL